MDYSSLRKSRYLLDRIILFGLIFTFIHNTHSLYANKLLNKRVEWSFSSGEKIKKVEITDNGTAYIFSKTELNVYDKYGTFIWKFNSSDGEIKEYMINDDIVYLRTYESLFSLNANGSERWSFHTVNDEKIVAFEMGSEGGMYVCTTTEFYSLDPVDGQEYWHFSNGDKINDFKLFENGELVYILTSKSVYALNTFSYS